MSHKRMLLWTCRAATTVLGFVLAALLAAAPQPAAIPDTIPAATEPETLPATTRPLARPRNDLPGLPNFAQVSDDLYRGAQPTAEGMRTLKKMGVKTVVDLRALHSDRDPLTGTGLRYVHIHANAWHPEDEDVVRVLKLLHDPENRPVFVHCQHGADRTGCMVAAYRMVVQGWTAEDAAAELRNFGFHPVFRQIVTYLSRFDPARMNKQVESAQPEKPEVIP